MKIYTRTGDAGDTSLLDGTRVPKSNARVEACGDVDELGAVLGTIRAAGVDADLEARLVHIQQDLFALGARLADPDGRVVARADKAALGDADAARLEQWIDECDAEVPALSHFVLAGGCRAGAGLHLARAVCRRAERRVVALARGGVDPVLVVYLNRLSDLLFVLARVVNHRAGVGDLEW